MRGSYTIGALIFTVIACSLFYWLLVPVVPLVELNDLLDGPMITLALLAVGKYATWGFFNFGRMTDRVLMLRGGITLSWISIALWRISRFLYAQHLFGPDFASGARDAWRGYMITLMLIAAVMHIVAIDMDRGRPRQRSIMLTLAAMVFGIIWISGAKWALTGSPI